ncbi:MAG: glycosyltransferase, partial [Rhizobiales bacterium]|nr:glycosyltransferase [Hyphomicrobiales bacterium]
MRILILASAVGRFGDGATGGVSRYAQAMVEALSRAGHTCQLLVPEGSALPSGLEAHQVSGTFQASAAIEERKIHPVPSNSVLSAMLDWAHAERGNLDRIINLNHDYLPVFATGLFEGKLWHIPNLTSSDIATDELIVQRFAEYPDLFAAISNFQAARLGLAGAPVLWFGMAAQPAGPSPSDDAPIFWSGRITPEKGLEAAAAVASKAGRKLVVAGHVENQDYYSEVLKGYGDTIDHRGFLNISELLKLCSEACATLQTQSWEEALGLTTIEALAAG